MMVIEPNDTGLDIVRRLHIRMWGTIRFWLLPARSFLYAKNRVNALLRVRLPREDGAVGHADIEEIPLSDPQGLGDGLGYRHPEAVADLHYFHGDG